MNILVTGGAGYIGTTLVPMLLAKGYEVTVFDHLLWRGDVLIPFFRNPRFHFIKGDVRDEKAVYDACTGKDVVIHLAAIVGLPACAADPKLAQETNYEGSVNVGRACQRGQHVLYGSTGSNYGEVLTGVCTEETPLKPLSVYGTTKTDAERYLMATTECTAFRFATAFGLSPRLRLDLLVNDVTTQAVNSKFSVIYEAWFRRTFIHVHDMARAFLFAIEHRAEMQGQVYNVGSEVLNHSKRDICDMIQKKTGAYFHYAEVGSDGDKRNYSVSYEKIKRLGYETTISVEQGIDELVKAMPAIKILNPYANV